MVTEQDIPLLLSRGERNFVDFKEMLDVTAPAQKAEFIRDIISFANVSSSGSRFLLIGVRDHDRSVVGFEANDPLVRSLKAIALEWCNPAIPIEVYDIQHLGKCIVVVEIKETSVLARPFATKKRFNSNGASYFEEGAAWIRHTDGKRPLIRSDLDFIYQSKLLNNQRDPLLSVLFDNGLATLDVVLAFTPDVTDQALLKQIRRHQLLESELSWPCSSSEIVTRFVVRNNGNCGAQHVKVTLSRLQHESFFCLAVGEYGNIAFPNSGLTRIGQSSVVFETTTTLLHNNHWVSGPFKINFQSGPGHYEFRWTAHASNQLEPTSGLLEVNVHTRLTDDLTNVR
jgi:hypothetical protein